MRALRVTAGAAVLLFAAACGQAADQGAPVNQPTSPGPSSDSSVPGSTIAEPTSASVPPVAVPPPLTAAPEGATLLPRDQVDTSGLPPFYTERNVWSLNGGRTLALSAMAPSPCQGVQARVVEQNAELVRIVIGPMDVPQGGHPDGGGMCAQVVTPRVVTVDLKAPLGGRKVIVTEGA